MMSDLELNKILFQASIWVIPVLLAVTFHEAAHGWVAWKRGDDTAYMLGRVTFNPIKHIDPFGTVLLPAMLLYFSGGQVMFGYAKPVPVNFNRLFHPRKDMVLVALAGPGVNLLLAIVGAFLFYTLSVFPPDVAEWITYNLGNLIWINLLLCVFNMLPIPPLDGGRVAVGLLPRHLGYRLAGLERTGMFIILGAIFLLPWLGGKLGMDLNIFWWIVGAPASYLMGLIVNLAGIV
jgi:Zn-dependent protease